MVEPDFIVNAAGEVVPVVVSRTLPRRDEPRRVSQRIVVGDWVAPLPGTGLDFPAGCVERAEDCNGLDNDRVLIVLAGGLPHMVRGSQVYRVDPPG
ncbi:hypothetical protein ACFRCG_16315 [Embleya sp. NPDC056575]|uniref:hypothetical protein n=1 Tax=unclassified Embleya TaxID=2699296 RepID=UPI0036873CDD